MNANQNQSDTYLDTLEEEPCCDVCGSSPAHYVIYENRYLCDECDVWVQKAMAKLYHAVDEYCMESQYAKRPVPDTKWKAVMLQYDRIKNKLDIA